MGHPADGQEQEDWPAEPPIDADDHAWYRRQVDHDHPGRGTAADAGDQAVQPSADDGLGSSDHDAANDQETISEPAAEARAAACRCGADSRDAEVRRRWPAAFRPPGWRPLTPAQLAVCAPTVVMHVHLTDQTLADNHGVVRTDDGPITVEQLHRFLVQHDANIKIYPMLDPAATADGYEIHVRLRRAMAIRHPRSVFPHSPTTRRMDVDHTPAYVKDGPPGQTGMHTLGPLARSEHRPKTVGKWRSKQPETGTYLWRSPENWIMITTNQGTLTLGHSTWATRLWNSAA